MADRHSGRPRALLINPPVYDFAYYDLYALPLGLMRLGTWLAGGGYDVRFLDCLDPAEPRSVAELGAPRRAGYHAGGPGRGKTFRTTVPTPSAVAHVPRGFARYGILPDVVAESIASFDPDLVTIATGMTYWYPGAAEAATTARAVRPGVPVVAGGVYATLLPQHCREALQTDHVVAGAAEPAMRGLLPDLGLPVPQDPFPVTPVAEPGWYHGAGIIKLSDGCPFHCEYCASGRLFGEFIVHPTQAWLEHLDAMVAAGIRDFAFYDDALLVAADRSLVPFLTSVIGRFGERTLRFFVPNALHVHAVTRELSDLLARAGFQEIRLGVESTDSAFHQALDAKLSLDQLHAAVVALRASGFAGSQITAYVLAGVPGQHARTVMRTLEDVERLGIRVSISEYSPVPGTPLFDRLVEAHGSRLMEEPLLHNNSAFMSAGHGFTHERLERIKAEGRMVNGKVPA